MQTIRDFLGAWLIVGALGLALAGVWGFSEPDTIDGQAVACADGATQDRMAALRAANVPRSGWEVSPELAGLPERSGSRATSYEVAEERNLDAIGPADPMPVDLAHGSSTSLNPTSMC
jgi:hypothetical protein